jgi:anti-anti-sigma factor
VPDENLPVRWTGRQAIVTLPEHISASNAGQIRDELLAIISRGAAVLIADMTATVSCDHGGADALVRVLQRATVNDTELRLVVAAQIVRRVLEVSGLDRLVSIYPDLETAVAAGGPGVVVPLVPRLAKPPPGAPGRPRNAARAGRRPLDAEPPNGPGVAAITPALLWKILDALTDGLALTDDDGMLVLVNRRLAEMFGYQHGDLAGRPVESLLPADLRAAHSGYRAGYAQDRRARPMGAGARLVGLRRDGATFPVEISLSPVPTATGHFTLAVVRDTAEAQHHYDLADLARAAVAAQRAHQDQELLDRVVDAIFHVGLSLEGAVDLPHDTARQRISEALRHLDDTVREIRDHAFAFRDHGVPPRHAPPDDPR